MSAGNSVLFDARWSGAHGIGRFSEEVQRRIPGLVTLDTTLPPFHPLDPLWTSWLLAFKRAKAYFTPGYNAPLWSGLPLVITICDLNYVHCESNSDPLRRAYFRHLVRPACRRAFRVLTISEFSRGQIIEWAGIDASRVVNVSAAADERFRPEGARRELGFPYVLAVGNERPHKNNAGLLRAFAASGLARDIKLVITGKLGPDALAVLGELRLADGVHLIGRVPDEDLPGLYRGALALCMPSRFEGFGLPVIEAMACGTPVLTSTATCLPEIAGSAAILTDPDDVAAMAAGLYRLVTDRELRAELIPRGIARSKEFSWDRTARGIEAVLGEIN